MKLLSVAVLAFLMLEPSSFAQAVDGRVTQENIHQTICSPGYTKRVRPPLAYTNKIKRQQMRKAGITLPMHDFELDHLVPLEIGGAPTDPHNLRLQPIVEARRKDVVETQLAHRVCRGDISLKDAQSAIVRWPAK